MWMMIDNHDLISVVQVQAAPAPIKGVEPSPLQSPALMPESQPSTSTTQSELTEDLHNQFRHLLEILILATAYNAHSVPLLHDPHYKAELDPLDDNIHRQVTHEGVLGALATVLVRNHEIIALTDVAPSVSDITPSVLATLQVDAGDGKMKVMSNFVCTKNPDNGDDYISADGTNRCMLLSPGKPLEVVADKDDNQWWRYFFSETSVLHLDTRFHYI